MSEHKELERALAAQATPKKGRPTCLTCRWCNFNEATAVQGMGECWYMPPVAVPIMVADRAGKPALGGKMGINPPVNLNQNWCAHHEEEKITLASRMPIELGDKGA